MGGGLIDDSQEAVGVWSNSPQMRVTLTNTAQGFHQGQVRWHNVPAGAYLISGRGVAEGATNTAGTLAASLSLPGGGSATWKLESNLGSDYRFAVGATAESGFRHLPKAAAQRPIFGVELGGSGVIPAMDLFSVLNFPVYLMPGLHDNAPLVRKRLGSAYSAFAVGPDRFLMLDNRAHTLGKEQMDWVGKRLQDFRLDGARRVFVFMARPPTDPRRHFRDGLENRREARRLARLLKSVRTATIFASHAGRTYTRTWYGFKEYLLSGRDVMVVESKGNDLSFRLPIH